jgi:hypothetical protein
MKRSLHFFACIVLMVYLFIPLSSYAVNETVAGYYGIYGASENQEIYGQYVNSESYSRLGTLEAYDPGYLEYFWDWHLRSETEVTDSQGTVTASSQTPNSVAAWVQGGSVSLDLNESVEALAWTNTQSVYSPDTDETIDISFYSESIFNPLAGLVGDLTIYFGIWENDIIAGNLMLDEKDGWVLSQLDYDGQQYSLLQHTYTGYSETITNWSLEFQTGNNYTFFTYMAAETAPEPTTLLLLGTGAFLMRRRKK